MTEKATRTCLRDPIPEIEETARLLDAAAAAIILTDLPLATQLVVASSRQDVREWTESLWGGNSSYVALAPARAAASASPSPGTPRMPDSRIKSQIHARDGYRCRFCGIPVIRAEVRQAFQRLLPAVQIWGSTNEEQHAGFQAMWAQYDHIVPHSRGGETSLDNMVLTCAPCNYGRMHYLVEEVGLADPRSRAPLKSDWDGLERVLGIAGPRLARPLN